MSDAPRFTIRLAKEDFKFSVAHFTLLAAERAEPLHGHNYRLELEASGEGLDARGLLVDCEEAKAAVRAFCARLDDRVLVPAESPELAVARAGGEIEVRYGARRYRFPADEVALLPLVNSSMELLARWAWAELAPLFRATRVSDLAVTVAEAAGQSCRYTASL